MARWKLNSEHYLNLDPSSEYEHRETDQLTGATARTVHKVPTYLDGKAREIIVCYKGKGEPRDLVFIGEPTPEMEALDDEAKAISESLHHKWIHPIDALPGTTYSESLLAGLEKQLAQLIVSNPPQAPGIVNPAEFAALQKQVKDLMEQNAALKQTQPIARRA